MAIHPHEPRLVVDFCAHGYHEVRATVAWIITDFLSPDAVLQVWFRVNDLLPDGQQKSLPDRPPEMLQHSTDAVTGKSI